MTMSQFNSVPKLVDLCAMYVAANIPFELVEKFKQPIPEDLQLKITYESFPPTIDNIRLYSCLANGNVDEYLRGEQLYQSQCVLKIIQIGFHLSAQVSIICAANSNQTNSGATMNNQNNNQVYFL